MPFWPHHPRNPTDRRKKSPGADGRIAKLSRLGDRMSSLRIYRAQRLEGCQGASVRSLSCGRLQRLARKPRAPSPLFFGGSGGIPTVQCRRLSAPSARISRLCSLDCFAPLTRNGEARRTNQSCPFASLPQPKKSPANSPQIHEKFAWSSQPRITAMFASTACGTSEFMYKVPPNCSLNHWNSENGRGLLNHPEFSMR